jgi:hypothetical protein
MPVTAKGGNPISSNIQTVIYVHTNSGKMCIRTALLLVGLAAGGWKLVDADVCDELETREQVLIISFAVGSFLIACAKALIRRSLPVGPARVHASCCLSVALPRGGEGSARNREFLLRHSIATLFL